MNLNELHKLYLEDPLRWEYDFSISLLDFIKRVVYAECRQKHGEYYDKLQDAIGESCLEVWKALPSFKPGDALFTSFVTRIILNNFVDIIRKYKKRQELELFDNMESPSPYRNIEQRISVKNLIDSLDDADKSFVQMKLDGLSEAELGKAFGRDYRWAKDKWQYLRRKFRLLAAVGA